MIDYITLFIINIIFGKNTIIDNIIFGVLTISYLIYLEIITLNFCDLNKNIKDNIIQREKNEKIKELISESDNIDLYLLYINKFQLRIYSKKY